MEGSESGMEELVGFCAGGAGAAATSGRSDGLTTAVGLDPWPLSGVQMGCMPQGLGGSQMVAWDPAGVASMWVPRASGRTLAGQPDRKVPSFRRWPLQIPTAPARHRFC